VRKIECVVLSILHEVSSKRLVSLSEFFSIETLKAVLCASEELCFLILFRNRASLVSFFEFSPPST